MKAVDISANHKEDGVEGPRKIWAWRLWFSVAGLILLTGCGEVGGAGQCFGAGESGLCVTIDSVAPSDAGGVSSNDVDAFQSDCDGDGTPDEFFAEHLVDVTFSSFLMPGVQSPPAPSRITFTNYLVNFVPNPNNPTLPPVLTSYDYDRTFGVNAGSSITESMLLVSFQDKLDYSTFGDPAGSIYTVTLQFVGRTEYNQAVVVGGQATITMADFDAC